MQIFFPHWLWTTKRQQSFLQTLGHITKETVYKFSFLIGSGHFLYCLPLSDFRLPRYKQYSSMSIPKSNSKIVLLSLLILYIHKPKAQEIFIVARRLWIFRATRT